MALFDVPKNLQKVQKEFDTGKRNLAEYILGTGYYGIAEPIESAVGTAMQVTGIPQAIQYGLDQTDLDEQAGQFLVDTFGERTMRNVGEATGMLGGVIPLRFAAKLPTEMQRAAQNIPNQLPGFYSGPVNRLKATGKGLVKGLQNYLVQSVSPQGMADFNQLGISKTMRDAAEGRGVLGDSAREKWGQASHENLLSTQYGNLGPALAMLDDDYFTYKGVMGMDDFSQNLSIPDQDTGAFFRTIMANWKVKNDGKAIMVVRKDKAGAENSGDMRYSLRGTQDFQKINSIFTDREQTFNANRLISGYSWSETGKAKQKQLSAEDQQVIRDVFAENPEYATLPVDELNKQLKKHSKKLSKGVTFQGIINKAVGENKQTFATNTDVVKALVKAGIDPDRIRRNKDQADSGDPDVYLSSSAVSSYQELGGVNVVYKVGKDGKLTAVVSDDYDLFGVRGPQSKRLITVLEPLEFDLAKAGSEARIAKNIREQEKKNPTRGLQRTLDRIQEDVTPTARDTAQAVENQANIGLGLLSGVKEEQEERGN